METKLTDVKNRQKRIQILKLVFFTLTLHFLTSNEITTHRNLSLPLTTSIYLVFLPLEIQTDQLYHAFLNLFEKNNTCTQTDIRFFSSEIRSFTVTLRRSIDFSNEIQNFEN